MHAHDDTRTTAPSTDANDIIRGVLDGWKSAIDHHEPDRMASYFTPDALFQGFRPTPSFGLAGVIEYYDSQPLGLTAEYRVLDGRRLADDVVLGYQAVDFGFTDRATLSVHLTVVLRNVGGAWLISHYHVSKIGG